MTSLKPGDEVRVFDRNGPRNGEPPDGWPGVVTKVGRTLVHVSYRNGWVEKFGIDDGHARNAYSSPWIRTLEQVEALTRKNAAGTPGPEFTVLTNQAPPGNVSTAGRECRPGEGR